MPEGVELRLSCDHLQSIVKNKTVINTYASSSGRFAKKGIVGFDSFNKYGITKIADIKTKGKFMYWSFDNGYHMFCTYGMTGQWSQNQTKHTAFTIQYVDKFENIDQAMIDSKFIHFNDARHFGTLKFTNSDQELEDKLNSLGWDPLQIADKVTLDLVKKKINKKKPIGELLMNQNIFSGVGNYIRAEALYRAKINPWKHGKELAEDQVNTLLLHIIGVMQDSYYAQGASFNSYVNVDNENGKYSNFFKVYAQKTDPNGYNIIREKMGTRTIHWCPTVQV